MKNTLEKNKYFILTVTIVIAIFYWSFYRPSVIKKTCNTRAITSAQEIAFTRYKASYWQSNLKPAFEGAYSIEDYKNYYSICLRSRGI